MSARPLFPLIMLSLVTGSAGSAVAIAPDADRTQAIEPSALAMNEPASSGASTRIAQAPTGNKIPGVPGKLMMPPVAPAVDVNRKPLPGSTVKVIAPSGVSDPKKTISSESKISSKLIKTKTATAQENGELDDASMEAMRKANDKKSKTGETLSNIMKKSSDTEEAITQNLK